MKNSKIRRLMVSDGIDMPKSTRKIAVDRRLAGIVGAALAAALATWSPAAADPAASVAAGDRARKAPARPAVVLDEAALRRFYEARNSRAAWTGKTDFLRASWVVAALLDADKEGLDPDDYHARAILQAGGRAAWESSTSYEVTLTDGVLRYARDVRVGRLAPASVDSDTDLPEQAFDAVAALETALEGNSLREFLAGLPPPQPEYAVLRTELARYRAIAEQGGLSSVPRNADHQSQALLSRLVQEDPDLDQARLAADKAYADEALLQFQRRNGLVADGRLTRTTLEALNRPVGDTIAQIALNMERWRWLPRQLEPDRIEINVPDATLTYFRNGARALASRVVVGKPRDRTPILRATATALTFNPSWDIPMSIARNEILPALHRDSSYLVQQDMIIVNGPAGDPFGERVPWKEISSAELSYQFRQLPGANNALGSLKLEMPNRFGVYLHDTPGREVFARKDRDLSHGCLRVEKIQDVASIALDLGPETGLYAVRQLAASGVTVAIPLQKPVPVYLLYWTTVVDENDEIAFRQDIYRRDERLAAALAMRRKMTAGDASGSCIIG